jgi:cytidine deaminase
MNKITLNEAEFDLISRARELISKRHKQNYHNIASVLITKSGKIFEGIHIEANVGRIAVCAEAIAIGAAASNGDTDIDVIVAVNKDGKIVSPCGMCRELISDYATGAYVILGDRNEAYKISIEDLLPAKFRRE